MSKDTSVDTDYHLNNIKEDFNHPQIEITEYDKNLYMLERKMGEWEGILNASDYNLGTVQLTRNAKYKNYYFKKFNANNNISEYYDEFFNIKNMDTNKINVIVEEYLKGLFWVFNFYFNKDGKTEKNKTLSIWYYKYHKAPLLKQISQYFLSINIKVLKEKFNIFENEVIKNNNIKESLYMNKLEHYMYVTPINVQNNKPVLNKNANKIYFDKIFPDLNNIVDIILKYGGSKDIIDCRRVSFLNKCNLTCVNTIDYNTFIENVHNEI
jgi:hypothetical protein